MALRKKLVALILEGFINYSTTNVYWFMAHGSRLMAHASRLVAQGSWLMAKKTPALGLRAWGTQRQIFLDHQP